ncbi:MAG: 2,3,4,5-tetrahydropyridine-2,6-dicarboxylate N-succinyltransferase [Bacteriovoracia bacterium]
MKISKPQMSVEALQKYFESHDCLEVKNSKKSLKHASAALWYLDQGKIRACVNTGNRWVVNTWVKRAVIMFFQLGKSHPMSAGSFEYFDKLPVKKRSALKKVRVVPGAIARFGSFIEEGSILMPSFVNVGAYVGAGSMIDTWATIGSCAQIGKNVHIAGGAGVGGVLEPEQAHPVIIEDGAFLGSRCIVVEGVRVGKQAVLGAGVVLTGSTKIVDVRDKEVKVTNGHIPDSAIVVPGTYPKTYSNLVGEQTFGAPCAMIIGTRKESTTLKTSLNQALRDYDVAV